MASGFAGRSEHLARLDALLAGAATEAPTAVVITAVSGTAGFGKAALACTGRTGWPPGSPTGSCM